MAIPSCFASRSPASRSMWIAGFVLTLGCGDVPTDSDPAVGALAVVRAPSAAVVGTPLSVDPVIELRAPDGTPLRVAGITITVRLAGGTLAGTQSATTDERGHAVFPGLVLHAEPGPAELWFTCCDLSGVTLPLSLRSSAFSLLPLPSATIIRPAGAQVSPGVRVLDANGYAVAGAVVDFRLNGEGTLAVDRVTTDATGLARLPSFEISPVPGTATLTAAHRASGASVAFQLIGVPETLTIEFVDPAPEAVVAVGAPLALPRIRVATRTGAADRARVRYRVRGGEALFGGGLVETEVLTDANGVSAPVTLTPTGRGLLWVDVYAQSVVGYATQPVEIFTVAVVPPLAFACWKACVPFDFTLSTEEFVDIGVGVVDALGPVSSYPVQFTFDAAASDLWAFRQWGTEEDNVRVSSTAPTDTGIDGALLLTWAVPYEPGSYSITLSGPLIAAPWTFTATRR